MHSRLPILLSITFSSSLPAAANLTAQVQSNIHLSPAHVYQNATIDGAWLEPWFHPANTGIRGSRLAGDLTCHSTDISPFIDIPLSTNSNEVRTCPSSPNDRRDLDAAISEEVGQLVGTIETAVSDTVALGSTVKVALESVSSETLSLSDMSTTIWLEHATKLVAIARDDFRNMFPSPATTPGHAKRVKNVSEALEGIQQLVIRLANEHEIKNEAVERHLSHAKSYLQDVTVFVGDVAELYPAAIETLVLSLSAVLSPESSSLQSLLILSYLGPYVLDKDSIGGRLLKHVSGGLRS